MLSEKTIQIVKATAPVVEELGDKLTAHFYKRMFTNNPEVKPYFNPANQLSGDQPRALAGAVIAYAKNIDNLTALGDAVELIAQKHAALQVTAEQYDIVGSNLLGAIGDLLGEAATPEIVEAWAEAYGFLAQIFIKREAEIYAETKGAEYGWNGFKQLKIVRKEQESELITSFYLEDPEGAHLPVFQAGQYLTVRVPFDATGTQMRNYSLSDAYNGKTYRISVKREQGIDVPDGHVSTYLHTQKHVGDLIEIAAPWGEFLFKPSVNADKPLVLVAGGVGITPIISMLKTALAANPSRKITVLQAALDEGKQAFATELAKIAAEAQNVEVKTFLSEPAPAGVNRADNVKTGLIEAEDLKVAAPELNGDYYFCGPKPMMVSIYHQLQDWNVPASQIHFEFFGPKQDLERPAA